ncbi:hypothetical protein [Alkalicoccus chagannorensis]|uniref:hypothetical protein n=1 Tax=Alkalicoccus chagannorensis TaxID=427072 RepID=UPI00042A17CC|nr:hypothetical protein [Alkalicoccus chagannorensis]
MLTKLFPVPLLAAILVMLPAAAAASEDGEGGGGFTEIIFIILSFGVLAMFIFYMVRDHAK